MIFCGGSSLKQKSTGRTTLMPSRSFETRCTIRSRQLWIYLGSESCFRMSQSSTFRNTSRITGSNHTFWKSFYSIMLFLAFKYLSSFNSDLSTDQQSLEWMRLISRAISCEFMIICWPSSFSLMNCQNISIILLSFKYILPFYPPQVFSNIFHRCDPSSSDHLTKSSNTLRHWHFQDTKVITRSSYVLRSRQIVDISVHWWPHITESPKCTSFLNIVWI